MGKLKDLVKTLFIFGGLFLLLLDIVLDIYAVVSFYQEEAYEYLGILLLILLGSSLLVQIFSWLFYSYDKFNSCLSPSILTLLHVFQLGFFFRLYESLRVASKSFTVFDPKSIKWYLNQYLSVLRLIETFSESIPQLFLMLTIILQQGHLDPFEGWKAFGSASAIAVSVTMYHCYLYSILPDEKKPPLSLLAVYFLWNFMLISSRLTALALFASVLPCFIFIHFVCSWIVLFFFAWRSKTDFMQSPCGEWLFRATVGLIWYFNWFNVVKGNTKCMTLLYHGYILVDNFLLCSLWYWKKSTEPPYLIISQLDAIIIAAFVVSVYIIGLSCRKVYYKYYHLKLDKELNGGSTGEEELTNPVDVADDDPTPSLLGQHDNDKMRELAENFFSS